MPRPASTSLWKGYGLNEMPGSGSMNRHLVNTHGQNGEHRAEGIGQYSVPWGYPLASVAYAWEQPGDAIVKTGHPGYYMSNRYDSITPREAQKIPGFSPNSSVGAAPRQGIASTHLPGSGCAPGFTCAGPANPGTISTQSSASKNHISQRWMGNGGLDFSREMVGDPAPPAVIPREPYYYQDAPLLASDVAIQEMRQMGGGPTLQQAQQGWAGLAQARRQQAMSNFSVANDSSVAATAAPRDEARSNQTVTIVLSQSTLEIIGIVGGLLAIILVAFAVKGLIDAVF